MPVASLPTNADGSRRGRGDGGRGDAAGRAFAGAGAGWFTGCTQKIIEAAYADRAEGENIRFSQLIEEALQDRLSTIDTDAAAEQDRVEVIEREYLERLERERNAPLPGEEAPAASEGPGN